MALESWHSEVDPTSTRMMHFENAKVLHQLNSLEHTMPSLHTESDLRFAPIMKKPLEATLRNAVGDIISRSVVARDQRGMELQITDLDRRHRTWSSRAGYSMEEMMGCGGGCEFITSSYAYTQGPSSGRRKTGPSGGGGGGGDGSNTKKNKKRKRPHKCCFICGDFLSEKPVSRVANCNHLVHTECAEMETRNRTIRSTCTRCKPSTSFINYTPIGQVPTAVADDFTI